MILKTLQVKTQLSPTKISQIQQSSPSSPDLTKTSGFTEAHQIKQNISRVPLASAETTFFFEDAYNMDIGQDEVLKFQE